MRLAPLKNKSNKSKTAFSKDISKYSERWASSCLIGSKESLNLSKSLKQKLTPKLSKRLFGLRRNSKQTDSEKCSF